MSPARPRQSRSASFMEAVANVVAGFLERG